MTSFTWSKELRKAAWSPPAEESTGELAHDSFDGQCPKPQDPRAVEKERDECV